VASTGISAWNSAVGGAVARLRPIRMTALMAGLGLLPAAVSHGIGSETQRPFAVVTVGGIVFATVFTLLLLPLAYPWFAACDAAPVRPRNADADAIVDDVNEPVN
jgi:heavy metal efflux system protein